MFARWRFSNAVLESLRIGIGAPDGLASIGAKRIRHQVQPSILERSKHPISRRDIDPNVLKILYRLIAADYFAYLVGGGVRDLMMGRRPKDFDVATSAHPQQVRDLFRNSRLIGRRFRLVHVFFGPQNIEVATFRRRAEDVPEGDDPMIRHDNTFGTPEEDAFRRDFTINALFYDPRSFQVIDYVGGVADLDARLIRTVGDPDVRMREDPVRMIRAVRFATKLDFEIEPATLAAIKRHSGDLAKSSVPRLVEEIFRTLSFKGAERALFQMEQLGLLEVLLPMLSEHLRATIPVARNLEDTATARNLAALGPMIESGNEPSRALILGCLFADLHRATVADGGEDHRLDVVDFLRERGFSRADTDQMRLLMEAATHMMTQSRLSRRLVRRPYYPEARRLFELIAPTYDVEVEAFDRFLAETPNHAPRHRRSLPAMTAGTVGRESGDSPGSATGPPTIKPLRRRRRHRGGRRRRFNSHGSLVTATDSPSSPASDFVNTSATSEEPMQVQVGGAIGDDAAINEANRGTLTNPR
jgi:tRNA nucleotidyltransferase/poly(A) polymerase